LPLVGGALDNMPAFLAKGIPPAATPHDHVAGHRQRVLLSRHADGGAV
jgi:hypothetical protein